MKKKLIFKIARIELYNLFYSPIAWLLLIVFLIQTGVAYTGMVETILMRQNMGGQAQRGVRFITGIVFTSDAGVFNTVVSRLYLFIPLLTMGLMSREVNSGTIKLLYSSPVTVRQIVLGKFLAMMGYNLLLLGVVWIFIITALFNIPAMDIGLALSGLVGVYFLLGAFSAIGLFLSSLTAYQVVAAIGTLVVLGALSWVGTLWQEYDFFRDLTYFLSINGRTSHMINGLITTKDVIYFLVIICFFLGASVFKLDDARAYRPLWNKVGRYVVLLVAGLAVGYVTSRPRFIGYWDATANKTNTLTPNARQIIGEMRDTPLVVTTYVNLLDKNIWLALPKERNNDLAIWEPYLRFKPDISFRYVYYYDSTGPDMFKYYPGLDLRGLAEKIAKTAKVSLQRFETPEQIHREIDLRQEKNRLTMQLNYKRRTTFLRVYDDLMRWPGETEVSAAFKRLLQARLPKIGFVDGEGERSIGKAGDKQYKVLTNDVSFRYSLVNQGFDVETVSLEDGKVPADIAALVIADPRAPYDSLELATLRQYIDRGGNLLVAAEPAHAAFLAPVLQPLGIHILPGALVEPSKDFAPDLVMPYLTRTADGLLPDIGKSRRDSIAVSMPAAAALSYDKDKGFEVEPLLAMDSNRSWNRLLPIPDALAVLPVSNTMMEHDRHPVYSDNISFSAADGDTHGAFPTALSLTRVVNGQQQRIAVIGDADFMSNTELSRQFPRHSNFVFATGLYSWLTGGAFPIDTSRPDSKDRRMNLTDGGLDALKILFEFVLPGLLLIFASVLLVRRKRK